METTKNVTEILDLTHPEDAQYIWLPILVLVGVLILAGLVYALSRMRMPQNCLHFKRRSATRSGYLNVDNVEEDSDESMAGANDLEERNSISYLLDSRLQITPEPQTTRPSFTQMRADEHDIPLAT